MFLLNILPEALGTRAFADAVSPPAFAPDAAALEQSVPGAIVETLPGNFRVFSPPAGSALENQQDARFHQTYTHSIYVYAPRQGKTAPAYGLFRTITVHYDSADPMRALRYARLAACLLRLHREHFGTDAAFGRDDQTANVWLSAIAAPEPNGTEIGGETHGSEVYIWSAATVERTSLEWTRTLVHEWGHLTLPAARGYREPEGDAAGYLGERLYMKWLQSDTESVPEAHDYGSNHGDFQTYCERQVQPLIARWIAGGPKSPILDGKDTAGMDYYIGAVLAADEAFGSRMLGRALFTVLDAHPRDFLASLARVAGDSPALTVNLPAWTPLAPGKYTASVMPDYRGAPTGLIAFGRAVNGGHPLAISRAHPAAFRVAANGWVLVKTTRGATRVVLKQDTEDGEARQ